MTAFRNIPLFYSFFMCFCATLFILGCGGGDEEPTHITPVISLSALEITPVDASLKVTDTLQLKVTGTYSDNSSQNVTSLVIWSVNHPAMLAVSRSGLITALSAGTTTVSGVYEGQTITRSISIKALSHLSISPTAVTLAIASWEPLSVTGRYTDNSIEAFDSLVTWKSSDEDIASISMTGKVLGIAPGTVSITSNAGSLSASLSVTVSPATLQSIMIDSQITTLALGLTSSFAAIGIYSDGTEQNLTNQVVWNVSNASIASINAETGLLTALQAGTLSVMASKEGLSRSLDISVSSASLTALTISPSVIVLAKGTTEHVNVTAIFSDNAKRDVSSQVEWVNPDSQIATIGGDLSTVQGLLNGSTTLVARLLDQQAKLVINVTDAELVSLALSPVNASIPLGQFKQYSAQGTFTDGSVFDLTSQVTWLSSNDSQVLLSNTQSLAGLANTLAMGSSAVTAVLGDVKQSTLLTITQAQLSNIQIKPNNQLVAKGLDTQIQALGYYTDGSILDLTSQVTWSASDVSVANVLSARNGVVLSINKGKTLISAVLGGVSGLGNMTVTSASLQNIVISAKHTTIPSGITQQLIATGIYSDLSTQDLSQQVSWQSDDVLKATVANNNGVSGLFSAITAGQLSISASLGLVSEQINIEVTDAVLTAIQIKHANSQLNVASTAWVRAIASFSNSTTVDVSTQVNWQSSDINIAWIGNSNFDKGLVTALAPGPVNISAIFQGISAAPVSLNISLNVNLPKALNLSVQPNIILNDGNDSAQVTVLLMPSGATGEIANGTPITLTITEGSNERDVTLITTNGAASYVLQSKYDGFISLFATADDYSEAVGVSSTVSLTNAILRVGQTKNLLYENDTLKASSNFALPIRNLTNRIFTINQIDIGYLDPNDDDTFVHFPESPITTITQISDGDLSAAEFYFIGYELGNDIAASHYVISYLIFDTQSNTSFRLNGTFDFSQ